MTLLASASCLCHAGPVDLLVKRIAPGAEKHFQFILENGRGARNFFEISTNDKRVRIKGNSYVSMASGLNWYLKNYCGVSYSDCDSTLQLPKNLPLPEERIYKETHIQIGYRGYAHWQSLFWNWQDWEKEIDRMALNGVNVCPVFTGIENVWLDFLSQCGMSDPAAYRYLFGTEEVPKEWLTAQDKLQKKILRRMQNLGISPVFQAFTGVIPQELTEGQANLITLPTQTQENMVREESILSTDDPLFAQMAKKWYHSYEKVIGTAPFYYGSTCGQDLPEDIQNCLKKNVPEAVWIIPADEALGTGSSLKGTDARKAILLYRERTSPVNWKEMTATKTLPWIWTWNDTESGAQPEISLQQALNQPEQAGNNPETASLIQGVGNTGNFPFEQTLHSDLVYARKWQPGVLSLTEELKQHLSIRYGSCPEEILASWSELTGLADGYDPSQSFLCQRPDMSLPLCSDSLSREAVCGSLKDALRTLLAYQTEFAARTGYRKDLIRITAMLLEQRSQDLYLKFCMSFQERHTEKMLRYKEAFLSLIRQADELRSFDPALRWDTWTQNGIQDSKRNINPAWCRQLIRQKEKTSGKVPALHGILSAYCAPRWELFFNWALQKIQRGQIAPPQYQGIENAWYQNPEKQPEQSHPQKTLYQIITDVVNNKAI